MKVYEHKAEFGWEGDDGIGERLIQQIIDGKKTATCSFKVEYSEQELKETYETKGKIVTVLDSQGNPRCNIKVTDVFETTFGSPDSRLVEGEGDGNDVGKFQDDHRKAWAETIKNKPLTDEEIFIVELFELVEVNDQYKY